MFYDDKIVNVAERQIIIKLSTYVEASKYAGSKIWNFAYDL